MDDAGSRWPSQGPIIGSIEIRWRERESWIHGERERRAGRKDYQNRREARLTGSPPASKHEHPQEDAKDQDDEEDRDRDEEQDLGYRPEARGDSSETKKTGDQGNDEEDERPFEHSRSFQNAP